MPTYSYECEKCGPFTDMRPMALFCDPCACPKCGTAAPRTISVAPAIGSINLAGRISDRGIEAVETRPRRSSPHPAGCGCCMRRTPLPGALSAGGRVFTSHGPLRRGGH
jgi:putative FmdB family regulatory protein